MEHHNVAVIGNSEISKMHLLALQRLPNVKIQAIVGRQSIADQDALITRCDIDAVIITETITNAIQLIQAAAETGKHIFIRQPDFTSTELTILANVLNNHGIKLQVGFKRRFDSHYVHVREQLAAGALGNVHIVKITNRNNNPSGSSCFDIHDYDMAQFITRQKVVEVFGMKTSVPNFETAIVTLKLQKKALVIIDSSAGGNYGFDQRMEVFGEQGALLVDNVTKTNTRHYSHTGIVAEKPFANSFERYQQAFTLQLQTFFHSLTQGDVGISPSLQDVICALRISEAVQQSIHENKPIKIN